MRRKLALGLLLIAALVVSLTNPLLEGVAHAQDGTPLVTQETINAWLLACYSENGNTVRLREALYGVQIGGLFPPLTIGIPKLDGSLPYTIDTYGMAVHNEIRIGNSATAVYKLLEDKSGNDPQVRISINADGTGECTRIDPNGGRRK